jgi:uncharacterized phage-associated protein
MRCNRQRGIVVEIGYRQYSPATIANNFLWLGEKENIPITPMMLQKLVYFAYGWSLALLERKLFEEPIQAWRHGPVIPSIYYEFQRYGPRPIDTFATQTDVDCNTGEIAGVGYPAVDASDTDILSIIQSVWKNYKHRSAWDLSHITHEEGSPWSKAMEKGAYTRLDDADIARRSLEGIENQYAGQA